MSPDNTHSHDVVTAVLVAHDGAAWVPRVAHAVASQTRPVQRVVAVDTGSRDRSGAMLAQAFGRGSVFGMDRATGYGAAVSQALRHRAANTHVPPPGGAGPGERTEWVWLLHDDCEPESDSLEQLLLGASRSPSAAVLGPKILDWSDRELLLEAGITIDRVGRRITGVEPREVDQGQHDGDRDVLAVSSAGMLVRRDVWDEVAGFDPGMLLFREDTDFCWRVHAAGYRVRVVTDSVVYHVEASARNRRPASAAPRRRREERRNGLITVLGNLPAGPMLPALAGNVVLSVLRTLFFLLAKRPGAALDEFGALTSVAGHPLRLRAARQRRARGRQSAFSRLRADLPPGRSSRKLAEFITLALSKSLPVDTVGSHHATDDPTDDDSLLVDSGLVQRLLTSPGVLMFLALTTIALVAERSLLATTPLGGGALVPAWGGVSGLWREYLQGFHPAGIGSTASTPPYVAVIAVLATVLGGKPWLAVNVLLLGCVPLAGLTAFLATRSVTSFVPARVWAAMSYALLPVGMGAVAAGRLGTAVVLVLLPLIAMLAGRTFTGPRRRARRSAWAAALITAAAAAFVPLAWSAVAVAMAVILSVFGRGRRGAALNAGIIVGVPLVLLAPWTVDVARHPARFFLEAGLTRPGLASSSIAPRALLLLSPGGPGLPPFWVTAGLVAASAFALVVSGRRALVLAGWGVATIGLITAAAVSRVAVTAAGASGPVPVWPGAAVAIAGVGLLLAAVAAGGRIPGRLRSGGWRTPGGLTLLAVIIVACSAPLLAAAAWVVSGVRGPVSPAARQLLPEFVAVSSNNGLRLRTLVLAAGPRGSVNYSVLRSSDPMIGSPELTTPAAGQRVLSMAVAALTAPHGGDAQDQGRALADLGIGYVMLPAPVSENLARLLDGVPGLRPVSNTAALQLWRVVDPAARVTVVKPGGSVATVRSGTVGVHAAKAPTSGGTLVLAEPADGWSATLNGHPLTPLASPVDGWARGFRLPAGGGSLSISRNEAGRQAAVALEAIAVLVVAALGLPGARLAGEAEEDEETTAQETGRGAGRGRDKPAEPSRDRRAGRRGKAVPAPGAAAAAGSGATRAAAMTGAGAAAAGAAAAGSAPGAGAAGGAAGLAGAGPARGASRLRGMMPAGVRAGLRRAGSAGPVPGRSGGGSYRDGGEAHPDRVEAYPGGAYPAGGGPGAGRRRRGDARSGEELPARGGAYPGQESGAAPRGYRDEPSGLPGRGAAADAGRPRAGTGLGRGRRGRPGQGPADGQFDYESAAAGGRLGYDPRDSRRPGDYGDPRGPAGSGRADGRPGSHARGGEPGDYGTGRDPGWMDPGPAAAPGRGHEPGRRARPAGEDAAPGARRARDYGTDPGAGGPGDYRTDPGRGRPGAPSSGGEYRPGRRDRQAAGYGTGQDPGRSGGHDAGRVPGATSGDYRSPADGRPGSGGHRRPPDHDPGRRPGRPGEYDQGRGAGHRPGYEPAAGRPAGYQPDPEEYPPSASWPGAVPASRRGARAQRGGHGPGPGQPGRSDPGDPPDLSGPPGRGPYGTRETRRPAMDPGPPPGQASGRDGRRGLGRWIGRGPRPAEEARPYVPRGREPGDSRPLSPLPPLPPRASRGHRFGDPADGPPSDWGREQDEDLGGSDW